MRSNWIVMIVAACLASGCSVISTGGPTTEPENGAGALLSKPYHRMIATLPQPTWDMEEVVEGLQANMASFDDPSWSVLRKYLTPELQETWKPDGPIIVIENPKVEMEPGTRVDAKNPLVNLKGNKIAELHEDGRYVPQPSNGISRPIRLIKTGDTYRISSMQPGLVLTKDDLERAYRQTNLYFLNRAPGGPGFPAPDLVVPDPVWLRVDPKEDLVRTILDKLVQGPSTALRGAVHTVIPKDARLESVRAFEDRIVVDFAPGLHLSSEETTALKAQLGWTLNGVANGWTIEVTIGGEPYYGSSTMVFKPADIQKWIPKAELPAYYARGGALYRADSKGKAPAERVAGAAGQDNATLVDQAVSPDGQFVAARSTAPGGGIWVAKVAEDGKWEKRIDGGKLTAPVWHKDGTLWAVNKDAAPATVLMYRPLDQQQHVVTVAAPNLGVGVEHFKIARDGVRVAVVTRDDKGIHVRVGAITVDGAGLMITNFQPVLTVAAEEKVPGKPEEQIRSITWSDSTHLYVLVEGTSGVSIKKIDLAEGTALAETAADARSRSIAALGPRLLVGTTTDKETGEPGPVLEWAQDGKDWKNVENSVKGVPLFELG